MIFKSKGNFYNKPMLAQEECKEVLGNSTLVEFSTANELSWDHIPALENYSFLFDPSKTTEPH